MPRLPEPAGKRAHRLALPPLARVREEGRGQARLLGTGPTSLRGPALGREAWAVATALKGQRAAMSAWYRSIQQIYGARSPQRKLATRIMRASEPGRVALEITALAEKAEGPPVLTLPGKPAPWNHEDLMEYQRLWVMVMKELRLVTVLGLPQSTARGVSIRAIDRLVGRFRELNRMMAN